MVSRSIPHPLMVTYKKVDKLKQYENNARTHSDDQINQIVASINEFGFTNPLLTDEDEVPELEEVPVSKLGDIWILGNHRLLCEDSTIKDDVARLMDGDKADMVFTDPPYNVDYSNAARPKPSKKDLGKIKNDAMSAGDFYLFLLNCFKRAYEVTNKDASAYIWHASAESVNFINAFVDAGFSFTQQIIWKKPMLLDLFGGSGSTLIACEKTNRRCYMMELDEHYVDVIIQRWQNYTGKDATRNNICYNDIKSNE